MAGIWIVDRESLYIQYAIADAGADGPSICTFRVFDLKIATVQWIIQKWGLYLCDGDGTAWAYLIWKRCSAKKDIAYYSYKKDCEVTFIAIIFLRDCKKMAW